MRRKSPKDYGMSIAEFVRLTLQIILAGIAFWYALPILHYYFYAR